MVISVEGVGDLPKSGSIITVEGAAQCGCCIPLSDGRVAPVYKGCIGP